MIVAEATGKRSTAARMEEFVFERVAEDCNLTLDVGVWLRANCAPNECQKRLPWPKRSDNSGVA